MGHYAQVIDGRVVNVIKAEQDFIDRQNQRIQEASTSSSTTTSTSTSSPTVLAGVWIQTSFNTRGGQHYTPNNLIVPDDGVAIRGNYAGIGYIYDSENDVFYPPQLYKGWTISTATGWRWTPPQPYPQDGFRYNWDNDTLSWAPYTGTGTNVHSTLTYSINTVTYTGTVGGHFFTTGTIIITP